MTQKTVRIIEESRTQEEDAKEETLVSPYEQAKEIEAPLDLEYSRQISRFVDAVCEEIDKEDLVSGIRMYDEVEESDDINLGLLFALPDESLFFVGSDPTAKDSVPLFGFVIERHEPIPAPRSAEEALNLLKPADVQDALDENLDLSRQGEWWLLPTKKVPVGSVFNPGVNKRPFGPSPLDNHIPRDYGFMVKDSQFVENIREMVPELPSSLGTPSEIIEWFNRQHNKTPVPEFVPEWEAVWEAGGGVLVRGTLRHRENDHYVENIGEGWHEAVTHDMDVYTGDDMIDRVRID